MVLLLAGLVLLPMFWLALTSVRDDAGRFSLEHYRQLVLDPAFVKPLATTLWTSAAVGLLCVAAAAPMSWLVSRTDLPGKQLLRMLILASFVTPPFLGAFAWVLLGGPNAGLINQWYYAMFGLKPFEAAPLVNIFSAWGMVFVNSLYTFPYVFTFVANSLDSIPSELEEASAMLGGKTGGQQRIRLGAWKIPALGLFAFVLGCSIALPYGVLLRTSFVKNWARPLADNLTLEHWRFVFLEFSQTKLALQNTFVLGIAAATAGTILVTAVGYLSLRKIVWGHRSLAFLANAPVAIPGIVLAVGLFLSYTRPPLVLYGTLWIIFFAYLTKELPVGYQQISASLKAVHPELEDASRIFGATRLRALFDITAPLIRNGVIATWIFIFIGSIRELSATILLFTARTKTISVTMFDLRESNDWGPIAVLSTTMLLITFGMVAAIYRFTDRRPT